MHMESLFYFLAFLQIAVGCYLIWQGLQWLGYVRRRLLTDPGFYAPRLAVLCPCKGVEPGLERNLVALTEFNHQNYEIFFILASASDPAAGILKRVAAGSRPKAHVIIADKPEGCSEKVNNLRVAIEQLPPEFDVLVFADSDGRPGKTWLQRLSAPLNDPLVGATTTMRWLVPNRGNLASTLLAAWNAPIVTMLNEKGKNFCWGGGTAIRRERFEAKQSLYADLRAFTKATRVESLPLDQWLKRPENTPPTLPAEIYGKYPADLWDIAETDLKYEGYIRREQDRIDKTSRQEGLPIPVWVDYSTINGLRAEATQKLGKIRPETLGQAARISGVTPADIALLTVWIARGEKTPA